MNSRKWLAGFFGLVLAGAVAVGGLIIGVDPFFHYHKPLAQLFYRLHVERYQNDGIVRNFDYDSIIVGASMVDTYKTSLMDSLFGGKSVKIPLSAGSFYETNNHLLRAYKTHDVKNVVRSLEFQMIIQEPDFLREDLGDITYPLYLYNDNPFDDVEYVLNKDVLFEEVMVMLKKYRDGEEGGITSFDRYANYMYYSSTEFSREACLEGRKSFKEPSKMAELSEDDRKLIWQNVTENLVSVAREHPETTFYYFIPPWSVVHWGDEYASGKLKRTLDAERIMVSMLLECDNIHLFSFNMWTDVTENLDLYKDPVHCTGSVHDEILQKMHDDDPAFRLTRENYEEFLNNEMEFYMNYDYNSIFT
ncbi:MAG: hypothetical protein Q4A32_02885 [Lachnospiraceae bacterium]|nr:hypothetical protein [Lachnospiraceae bacterium]